ncbi:MAG TPA: type VI secretion system tube protein TssD [Steroidobacteraceae bacterium]|jgi:type VI secretion system secreted protein Hcp|nr:type VI secretion system tube protein TssD [Steroidobacteraceae bacterium]
MSRFMYFLVAGLMMLAVALPASAADIYCTVMGTKQGKFQGDPGVRGDPTQILVYALTEDLKVPFDASSGLSTGRRQHSPLTIVKELDKSSPQFFLAAVTNETLKSVTCTLYRASGGGGMTRAYYKIALTNATVVEIANSGDGVNGSAQGDERERISFTYQKIELTDLDSNTYAFDDWASAG